MRLSLAFWKHAHNIHSRDAQKKNVVNIVDILGYQGDHDKMARTKTLTEQHKKHAEHQDATYIEKKITSNDKQNLKYYSTMYVTICKTVNE